ncbi:MAG: type II toxin-antitoxin system HicB family antitoxin [Syntrophobacteraceae bacterium]
MFQYSFDVLWSDEDGGYIARIPELPDISGFGETPEKAVKEARTAAKLALQVIEEDGEPYPVPKKLVEYSGQTRLRMPKSLHRDLTLEAAREGISLNSFVVVRLSEQIGSARVLQEVRKLRCQVREIWEATQLDIDSAPEPAQGQSIDSSWPLVSTKGVGETSGTVVR